MRLAIRGWLQHRQSVCFCFTASIRARSLLMPVYTRSQQIEWWPFHFGLAPCLYMGVVSAPHSSKIACSIRTIGAWLAA